MMYESVTEILKKAKEDGADIGVAYDRMEKTDDLRKAFEFLRENQIAILKLRNAGRNEELKVLCNMAVADDKKTIRKYINALYSEGIIER